ncbi:hypothetical protein FB451DRAFT_1488737 [Mycena latifolia]|nr:hypothetical protein FB451DRAFT_1488737 [Mycena latifolia]
MPELPEGAEHPGIDGTRREFRTYGYNRTEIRGGLVEKGFEFSEGRKGGDCRESSRLVICKAVSKFSLHLPPSSRNMSTTANDGTSGNHGNDGYGGKGDGRGGRERSGSADPEQEAKDKAECKQRRREERRAAEAEHQEEWDRRDAERDQELEAAREELNQLCGLLSAATGGPGADGQNGGEGEVNTEVDSPVEQETRCDRCVQRRLHPCIVDYGKTVCKACSRAKTRCSVVPPDDKCSRKLTRKDSDAESSVDSPVVRKARKTAKSPTRCRIHKQHTIELEVEEVPLEVAEAGPQTCIDDLRVHLDVIEQRFDRRYDDLMSHLRNFYRRSDELLRRMRHAEDGAEISLDEIFERQEDIAERWGFVRDGLHEVWELEEADAAMDEEAEGSGDGESRNNDKEDEPTAPEVLRRGPRVLRTAETSPRKVLTSREATGRRTRKERRRRNTPSRDRAPGRPLRR